MKIDKQKMVQVDVKTVSIHCKVSDMFTYQLKDADGEVIFNQDDGYVPGFMPGHHYGDYVILDIDIDTGLVTNWTTPSAEEIQTIVNKSEDE